MKIRVARSAGFCMGVRRALDMALETSNRKTSPLYTLGPLIHNPQVISFLEQRGIQALEDIHEAPEGATVIIRAHGISPEAAKKLEAQGLRILDATCPRVKAVQRIIRRRAHEDARVIIVGDREHPEVIGLLGHAQGQGKVVRSAEELDQQTLEGENTAVVAQTTMDEVRFQQVVDLIREHIPDCQVYTTICSSTHNRQEEVRALASEVDAMIVVGGKNSANTRRLAQISQEMGLPTYHVETDEELDLEELAPYRVVGVTAGASTPNWMIKKVVGRLREADRWWSKTPLTWPIRILRGVIQANLYVGLAAAALTFTNCLMMSIPPRIPYLIIAAMYVFSMHLLNRYTEDRAREFNDPLRAEFYERHARVLLPMGACGLMIAILTGLHVGILAFFMTLVVSFLGTMYSVRILPRGLRGLPYEKIKDLPGSKTISVSLAWVVVTGLLPALQEQVDLLPGPLIVLIFSCATVFVRSAEVEIQDIQGDRMVGKETLPVLLGEEGTRRWMSVLMVLACLMIAGATLLGWVPALGWWLALSGLYALLYLRFRLQEALIEFVVYEGMVDAHFLIMGAIAALWLALGSAH